MTISRRGALPMTALMNDKIRVIKSDGTEGEWLPGLVDSRVIYVGPGPVIEEGDVIEREMPSGTERYDVLEAVFRNGPGGRLSHYELRVEKQTRISKTPKASQHTISVSGTGNTVVVGSANTSINTVARERIQQTLEDLKREIEKEVTDAEQQADAKSILQLIQTHVTQEGARPGVIKSLLATLPSLGKIGSIVAEIVGNFSEP